MEELDQAVLDLQQQVDALRTPDLNTKEWWLLRGLSTSLSLLKSIQAKGLTPVQAETFRKGIRTSFNLPIEATDADATVEPVKP